jgi:hypothetical protein
MSKKVLALGLAPSENKGDSEEGPFLKVTGGEFYEGRYDVQTNNVVFWRGDARAPDEVFTTGFSSRYVREKKAREIVWRAGVDDIVPASAVCLARDIRGAAFFPYPDPNSVNIVDTNYLYAISVPFAACTFKIQKVVEQVETGADDWRDATRFTYDPEWSTYENASCVWQFAEYAVHEVRKWQVLAGWKCTRQILIKERNDERVQGGIRFKLSNYRANNATTNVTAQQTAQAIADNYFVEYPRRYPEFLSYWGVVEAMMVPPPNAATAKRTARQLRSIVVADDESWNLREDGVTRTGTTLSL